MAQGGEWVPVEYDRSLRIPCNHAYRLGEFLRMGHPEMKTIPKIKGRHIVDPICLQEGPEYLCYKVSDKVKTELKEKHQHYARFKIKELAHNTSLDKFLSIVNGGIIRPGEEKPIRGLYKDNPGKEESICLSWWGLSFNKEKTETYRNEMRSVLRLAGIDYNSEPQKISLLNSGPFSQPSRYGNFRITIPVNKLIKYYEASIGKCQLRILWTDVFYQCEVNHTILVHPENPTLSEVFKDLPLMDEYLESQKEDPVIIKGTEDEWIWCPQSTSVIHPEPGKFKAWDHVTFAFLIPEGCKGIKIPEEDLERLLGKVTLHSVTKVETKYEAMTRFLRFPKKLPNHLYRALVYRFKEYYDELVRNDRYGNEAKIPGHDEAIKVLKATIRRLEAEQNIPTTALRQMSLN